jgi:hypothetical protein
MEAEKFTINIEPIGENRLQVTIPEIGATLLVESMSRNEAVDAAHHAISEYLRQTRLVATAKAS